MKGGKQSAHQLLISLLSLVTAAAIIVGITLINVWGATGSGHTTFIGDEPWYAENVEASYKWQKIFGKIYVPAMIFKEFGYEIRTSSKSVTIASPSGEKYISFSTKDNEKAYTPERKEFYLRSYWFAHGVLGVPVSAVCEYFGLSFEMFPTDAKNEDDAKAIRISSGRNKYGFTDLLKNYNPSLLPLVTTAPPETTKPSDLPARAYLIYLTFEDVPNGYTEQILDLLDEYGYKATFFLNGDALKSNADIVQRIISSGHSVGLHTMTRDSRYFARDIQNFIDELRQENELLYDLFRVTTRLVRAPDGSRTKTFVISPEEGKLIESLGYIIWDFNVETYDDAGYSASRVADNAIEGIVQNEVPVLRFHSNATTVKALGTVLEYIKSHSDQFSVAPITPAAQNVSFVGK